MAFSPLGGPVWRDVAGFTPGQSYEISFEVRTLDPSDAGKATFLVDDKVLHSIRSNGKVSVKFTASQATHRIKFDWKVQSISMAPVHVTDLKISAEGTDKGTADQLRYVGRWEWERYKGSEKFYVTIVVRDGQLVVDSSHISKTQPNSSSRSFSNGIARIIQITKYKSLFPDYREETLVDINAMEVTQHSEEDSREGKTSTYRYRLVKGK